MRRSFGDPLTEVSMRTLGALICTALALLSSGCATRPDSLQLATSGGTAAAMPKPSNGSPAFGNFVRSRTAQLQFCYEDTRAASPALAGSATVAVTLGAEGNVLNADIIRRSWSGKGADVVESCMLSRVRQWRFPATNATEALTHSFAVIFTR